MAVAQSRPAPRHVVLAHGAALGVYTLLALALTWPLALVWNQGFLGFTRSFQDGIQNVWNMWWMRWALDHGQSPFWNPSLYYPDGLQMYLQAISAPAALLALPVTYLAGPTAGYNAATITAAALTGYTVFLLVRAFVPGWKLPLLGGALVVASPFLLTRLLTNQLNLTSMQWLPLYMLALLRLEQRRTWGPVCAAAAVVALLILTDWYWTLVAVLYTIAWIGTGLARGPERGWLLRRYASLAAVVLVVTAPFFALIYQARAQLPIGSGQPSPVWDAYVRGFSLDGLGLLYPAAYQPLWATPVATFLDAVRPGPFSFEGSYTAVGWVLLALAALGVRWHGRAHWRLLVCAAVGYLFALGPTLHLLGRNTGIPLPYALLQNLPLISTARRPNLYAGPCLIIAAIFAALALQRLLAQRPAGRSALLLTLVIALATVELWPPKTHDTYLISRSPVVEALRARPGAVVDLPYERQESSRSLLNQMTHEQPIVGGYVSRRPRYDALRFMPHLAQLSAMQPWPQPDILDGAAALTAAQCAYPVRHVLVARAETTPQQLAGLAEVLRGIVGGPLQPASADAAYTRYELPSGGDCAPFLYLGRGWQAPESAQGQTWRWASDRSDLWLANPRPTAQGVTLEIEAEAYGEAGTRRRVSLERDTGPSASFTVGRERRVYRLFVAVAPGVQQLRLLAAATVDQATGRTLSLSVTRVRLVGATPLPGAR